ncbi:MAG TPA: LamG domain-containing protein, partial [Thermoplasmatales archaeon]|nr:LamG domain-containing protein [Thermoplasmatales archaeon]
NEGTGNIAHDSIGNNNGEIHGASWVKGINDNALSFDGKNDYIRVSNNNLNPSNELTVIAWVKWDIEPSTGQHWANIISKNGDNEWQIQHSYGNDKFEFAVKTENARKYVWSTTKPVKGKWYQVAGVYDGKYIKIYVNGRLENKVPLTGKIKTSSSEIDIGRRTWRDRYFNGVIDEVSIYDKALTDEEIRELYNNLGG